MGNIFFKLFEEEVKDKPNLFMCPKCNKSNCSIRKKLSNTGFESSVLLIKCLECKNIFEFN